MGWGNAPDKVLTTMVLEWVYFFLVGRVFGIAPLLGDRIALNTFSLWLRVCNDLASLDVESLDFRKVRAGADELSNNGERLACIDSLSFSVEVCDTQPVRVEVAYKL